MEHENWEHSVLTTAWFIDQANHWFDLMCSRSPTMAFSLFDQEKYQSAVDFLQKFKEMFETVEIGGGEFKPVQTGIILSTTSILELQHILLHAKGYKFVLMSRFTQDSLENFFFICEAKKPNSYTP